MGEIADMMINGEICAECGVYLEPKEVVYVQITREKVRMPEDGEGFGIPVVCTECK